MLCITVDFSTNCRSEYSGYIQTTDRSVLKEIRIFTDSHYDDTYSEWEIPETSVAVLCNKLFDYDIEISGVVREPIEFSNYKFKVIPYLHQKEFISYALDHPRIMLGDDQGVGKTKEIIDFVGVLEAKNITGMILVISCINTLKYNWEAEVHKHSDFSVHVMGARECKNGKFRKGTGNEVLEDFKNPPDVKFLSTNIESIRTGYYKQGNKFVFPVVEAINNLIRQGKILMLVVDEAHKCKNPASLQTKALLKIEETSYIALLSGTFLITSPLDMYVPLFIAGEEKHSFYEFKNHFCRLGGFNNQSVIGPKNLSELQEMVSRCLFRRKKTDVLNLPPKIPCFEYLEMGSAQRRIYESVRNDILAEIDRVCISPNPLAELIRLRQSTAHTSILSSSVSESIKFDRMMEILEECIAAQEKCMIFSNWTQVIFLARDYIKRLHANTQMALITGQTKSTEVETEKYRFQNDPHCKFILGTIDAMGTGHTLTAATTIIFLDEPWSRLIKDQAEDRAHRISTVVPVRVVTLLVKDSIDERVNQIVYEKGDMADFIIDGKPSTQNRKNLVNFLLGC